MPVVTRHLKTSGMHCSSCSMLIDMEVGDLAGVSEVRTDHADGSTVVTFDDTVVTLDTIIATIRATGYEAESAD